MQAVHHLLFGKTSVDSLSVCIKSPILLTPPPFFLRLPAKSNPSNRLQTGPGFLLAHVAQLEQKARRTIRLRAHGQALTVGGFCDASMFTAKASILPWLLI
jgi:hypothetical protein